MEIGDFNCRKKLFLEALQVFRRPFGSHPILLKRKGKHQPTGNKRKDDKRTQQI
jgi:hypothetical protein